MLTTGNQLKAARALAGLSQADLAKAAHVNVTTISAMEGKGAAVLASGVDTVRSIMDALAVFGVECPNDGRQGVRLTQEAADTRRAPKGEGALPG
ncbi:helix-turn-helix transcriptional regulator [Bradyrhizobium sp. 2]|uniref:helix-turn-helix transcriptional regulator n=1 Tax=unclassified Bradyrhizobium TaxID=2631580 RepID=UPI001FF705E3|nr:helix-turn-helix transcriptional regulator [Bradyrhizobium sp. 2]MCK1460663.1 helix-turn-helix transcriptional regulator [Bradyrhizobium sp. 2]